MFMEITFFIYSLASTFSKMAGMSDSNVKFIFFYGCSFCFLGIYAVLWQKILSKKSLTYAYVNKGITLLWGLILGYFLFKEPITWNMVCGVIVVLIGIFIVISEEKV